MIQEFLALFQQEYYLQIWRVIYITSPVWLPLILLRLAFASWMTYIRRDWMQKKGHVLLEIKLPRETEKTPAAMEFVLEGMWEPAAVGTFEEAFWEGKLRDWFSLEIASIGGEVKFFIWTLPRWKKIIETRIYAQYPNAEVIEVEDYLRPLMYKRGENKVWGITTRLNKADAYPIKTYIDYELDEARSKEQEEVVDPLTPVLEYLGTLQPGEIAVFQLLIQAHRKEGLLDARLFQKKDWKGGIKDAIKEIIEKESHIETDKEKPPSMMNLTEDQKDTIKSIERNAGKLAFDAMQRILYVAPEDIYESTRSIGLIGSERQFGTHNLNGIRPDWFSAPGHSWEDFNKKILERNWRTHLDACKRRSFFNAPYKYYKGKPYVLTTEEVATLFHLPGRIATTPNLTRVPSKKAEAPSNLPI